MYEKSDIQSKALISRSRDTRETLEVSVDPESKMKSIVRRLRGYRWLARAYIIRRLLYSRYRRTLYIYGLTNTTKVAATAAAAARLHLH